MFRPRLGREFTPLCGSTEQLIPVCQRSLQLRRITRSQPTRQSRSTSSATARGSGRIGLHCANAEIGFTGLAVVELTFSSVGRIHRRAPRRLLESPRSPLWSPDAGRGSICGLAKKQSDGYSPFRASGQRWRYLGRARQSIELGRALARHNAG